MTHLHFHSGRGDDPVVVLVGSGSWVGGVGSHEACMYIHMSKGVGGGWSDKGVKSELRLSLG